MPKQGRAIRSRDCYARQHVVVCYCFHLRCLTMSSRACCLPFDLLLLSTFVAQSRGCYRWRCREDCVSGAPSEILTATC